MEKLDINTILERNSIKNQILDFLKNNDLGQKKGIFLFGETSIGKTHFIKEILKEDYNIIYLDSFSNRNKVKIEEFKGKNMTNYSIISSFQKKKKKIIIVIDDINTMNSGDKGGINNLVKLLKTKKHNVTSEGLVNPIICINNYFTDKKIIDLKKNLLNIEISKPTDPQIETIVKMLFKSINIKDLKEIVRNTEGNFNRLKIQLENYKIFNYVLPQTFYNKNKTFYKATEGTIINRLNIKNYMREIRDTDKTSISLLFHENIIDILDQNDISLYLEILKNIIFGDYIDKFIFKYQLWNFNEISFIIKILCNNTLLHNFKETIKRENLNIRFTKVLTKYSTEYSNYNFINRLCQTFNMDKKDLFLYINYLHQNDETPLDLKPLEIGRIKKFLDLL